MPSPLKLKRLLLDKTLKDVFKDIGISRSHLSLLERGKITSCSLLHARSLAKYYKCSIDDIFPINNKQGGKKNG